MNLAQIELLKKRLFSKLNLPDLEPAILFVSDSNSAGGRKGEKADKQEIEKPQASDQKREKDMTGTVQGGIANKAKDEKENASITEPDTNLTGDTGNLDIGQTDLGASGSGAEDL